MKFLFPKSTYYIYESFTVLFGSLYSFYQFNTNKNFKVIEQKRFNQKKHVQYSGT